MASSPVLAEPRPPLTLVTAAYPPFVNPPDEPQGEGIDIEIAREAARRAGRRIEVVHVPWKRALAMLEAGEADFTTTISRNAERDRYLLWTSGYRTGVRYHFYARRGSGLRLASLADLSGRRLGVTLGYFYPDAILRQPGVQIENGTDIATTVRMLGAGRTDFMVVNGVAGEWEIRRQGLSPLLERQPLEVSSNSPTYMAFSRARNLDAVRTAFDTALAAMAQDGTLTRIEKKYQP